LFSPASADPVAPTWAGCHFGQCERSAHAGKPALLVPAHPLTRHPVPLGHHLGHRHKRPQGRHQRVIALLHEAQLHKHGRGSSREFYRDGSASRNRLSCISGARLSTIKRSRANIAYRAVSTFFTWLKRGSAADAGPRDGAPRCRRFAPSAHPTAPRAQRSAPEPVRGTPHRRAADPTPQHPAGTHEPVKAAAPSPVTVHTPCTATSPPRSGRP
jgi:hypothetical protein